MGIRPRDDSQNTHAANSATQDTPKGAVVEMVARMQPQALALMIQRVNSQDEDADAAVTDRSKKKTPFDDFIANHLSALKEMTKSTVDDGKGAGYFFEGQDQPAFVDYGDRGGIKILDPDGIKAALALAHEHGWQEIRINNADEQTGSAIFIAATLAGMKVHGYAPTSKDLATVELASPEIAKLYHERVAQADAPAHAPK